MQNEDKSSEKNNARRATYYITAKARKVSNAQLSKFELCNLTLIFQQLGM